MNAVVPQGHGPLAEVTGTVGQLESSGHPCLLTHCPPGYNSVGVHMHVALKLWQPLHDGKPSEVRTSQQSFTPAQEGDAVVVVVLAHTVGSFPQGLLH